MYVDESGVPEDAGTSHFILLGLAVPADNWKAYEAQVATVKAPLGLDRSEIHTSWLARSYPEQERIPGFSAMDWEQRRRAVAVERQQVLMRMTALGKLKQLKETRKNFRKTDPYTHLTHTERQDLLRGLADTVGRWSEARAFAEAINKQHFYKVANVQQPAMEQAFTQVVERFEKFLTHRGNFSGSPLLGMIVQDNNETAAHRLTEMMMRFHKKGTKWNSIDHIIETPLFVDSHLTSMVQMADLCAFATRRYLENRERDLFDRVFPRFDRAGVAVVGIRHFTDDTCSCKICRAHSPPKTQQSLQFVKLAAPLVDSQVSETTSTENGPPESPKGPPDAC